MDIRVRHPAKQADPSLDFSPCRIEAKIFIDLTDTVEANQHKDSLEACDQLAKSFIDGCSVGDETEVDVRRCPAFHQPPENFPGLLDQQWFAAGEVENAQATRIAENILEERLRVPEPVAWHFLGRSPARVDGVG